MEPLFSPGKEKLIVDLIQAKNRVVDRVERFTRPRRGAVRMVEGRLRHPGDKYCVFVFYQAERVPQDFFHLFAALKSSGINLIMVANALPPGGEAPLAGHCHTLMVRNNFGYDFGGFQAGVQFAQTLSPSRLLMLNDSVHFLEKGLVDYIAQLSADRPFIGATESTQISPHVQSYAMSFGRDVLHSEAFRSFWANYRPMNEKRYTVFNGELGLSAHLRSHGIVPHAIFSAARLKGVLENRPVAELVAAFDLLSDEVKASHRQLLAKTQLTGDGGSLIGAILDLLAVSNQVAVGGFLFARYLGMPFMKKDLVFHLYFRISELAQKMRDAGIEANSEEMVAWYRARGNAEGASKWQQFRYRHMFA